MSKLVYLSGPKLFCNLDTSDMQYHGWLMDDDGIAIRRATEKQYSFAIRKLVTRVWR